MEKRKAKMSPVVLYWNRGCQSELKVTISIVTCRNIDVGM